VVSPLKLGNSRSTITFKLLSSNEPDFIDIILKNNIGVLPLNSIVVVSLSNLIIITSLCDGSVRLVL